MPDGVFKTGIMDLVKKKTVNFDLDTYERLSKLAAQLRMDNPGGGFVSMSAAVTVLLDHWDRVQVQWNMITITPTENEPG